MWKLWKFEFKRPFITVFIMFFSNIYPQTYRKFHEYESWYVYMLRGYIVVGKSWEKLINETWDLYKKGFKESFRFPWIFYPMNWYIFFSEFYGNCIRIFFILSLSEIFASEEKPKGRDYTMADLDVHIERYIEIKEQLFNDDDHFYFLNIFYNFIKAVLISFLVAVLTFNYLIFFFQINFLKQLGLWFIVLNLFFWLISGFNFFIKRYRFGKFTSAIQRFWKRANMCFWLVEGFLFLLFYYYFLNSSQEPVYMYDASSLNQEYLLSLISGFKSLVILALVIFLLTLFMLRLPHLLFTQQLVFLLLATACILNIFYIESYQFYYVLNIFNEGSWVFDEDTNVYTYTYEAPRLRTKQFYFLMCLIAKYWHFVFIFISWIFFLIKSFESKRVKYNLLSYNIQNLIILYVLNILTYAQWFKFLFHRYLETIYYWFFTNYDSKVYSFIWTELCLLVKSFFGITSIIIDINLSNIMLFSYHLFFSTDNFLILETINLTDL